MDLGLTGQVVLITGGSKGIGLACAHAFAVEGARIAIASRSADNLQVSARWLQQQGHAVRTVAADLLHAKDAEAIVRNVKAALRPVDMLLSTAGAAQRTPPFELTAADWHAAMDAMYFTIIHATQAVLAGLGPRSRQHRQRGGRRPAETALTRRTTSAFKAYATHARTHWSSATACV